MNTRTGSCSRILPPLACWGLLVALAACNVVPPAQDDPTRYYILSEPAVPASSLPAAGSGLRIGLRSVRVENYLKRREMVVRTGENEVQFMDYRRWAEPLDAAVGRVLRARLGAAATVAQVFSESFPVDQDRDYDVAVDVRRCEGTQNAPGRYVSRFSAGIEVWTAGPNPRLVARKVFRAPDESWDGRDYDRLANLLTADVSALGQEILSELPAKN